MTAFLNPRRPILKGVCASARPKSISTLVPGILGDGDMSASTIVPSVMSVDFNWVKPVRGFGIYYFHCNATPWILFVLLNDVPTIFQRSCTWGWPPAAPVNGVDPLKILIPLEPAE